MSMIGMKYLELAQFVVLFYAWVEKALKKDFDYLLPPRKGHSDKIQI